MNDAAFQWLSFKWLDNFQGSQNYISRLQISIKKHQWHFSPIEYIWPDSYSTQLYDLKIVHKKYWFHETELNPYFYIEIVL